MGIAMHLKLTRYASLTSADSRPIASGKRLSALTSDLISIHMAPELKPVENKKLVPFRFPVCFFERLTGNMLSAIKNDFKIACKVGDNRQKSNLEIVSIAVYLAGFYFDSKIVNPLHCKNNNSLTYLASVDEPDLFIHAVFSHCQKLAEVFIKYIEKRCPDPHKYHEIYFSGISDYLQQAVKNTEKLMNSQSVNPLQRQIIHIHPMLNLPDFLHSTLLKVLNLPGEVPLPFPAQSVEKEGEGLSDNIISFFPEFRQTAVTGGRQYDAAVNLPDRREEEAADTANTAGISHSVPYNRITFLSDKVRQAEGLTAREGNAVMEAGWLARGTLRNPISRICPLGLTHCNISTNIHEGAQGKHIPGHKNYIDGKSILSENPQDLLDSFHVGDFYTIRVINSNKVKVDFGKIIGTNTNMDGTNMLVSWGIIHSGKKGAHIVPALPDVILPEKS